MYCSGEPNGRPSFQQARTPAAQSRRGGILPSWAGDPGVRRDRDLKQCRSSRSRDTMYPMMSADSIQIAVQLACYFGTVATVLLGYLLACHG